MYHHWNDRSVFSPPPPIHLLLIISIISILVKALVTYLWIMALRLCLLNELFWKLYAIATRDMSMLDHEAFLSWLY